MITLVYGQMINALLVIQILHFLIMNKQHALDNAINILVNIVEGFPAIAPLHLLRLRTSHFVLIVQYT